MSSETPISFDLYHSPNHPDLRVTVLKRGDLVEIIQSFWDSKDQRWVVQNRLTTLDGPDTLKHVTSYLTTPKEPR